MGKKGEVLTDNFIKVIIAVGLLLVLLLILIMATGKGNIILDKFDNFWRMFT